jgi:hypothetical protein
MTEKIQFDATKLLLGAIAALVLPLSAFASEYPSIVQADANGCFSYEVVYVPETVPDFSWSESIECSNVDWNKCDLLGDLCNVWPSGCDQGPAQCPFVIEGPVPVELVDGCLGDRALPGAVTIDFGACGGSLLAETLILPSGSDCIDNSLREVASRMRMVQIARR